MNKERNRTIAQAIELIRSAAGLADDSFPIEALSGLMTCPLCNGFLHWTIEAQTGNVYYQCETENCLKLTYGTWR